MTVVTPTLQRPNQSKLTQVLDSLKREIGKDINCVRIGVIQAFHGNTVDVLIAQQQVTSVSPTGVRTLAEFPVLLSVPLFFPCGGGFTLTFPVAVGDECIVLFNDREIDNWYLNGKGTAPSTTRTHDLSDGIALVGIRNSNRVLSGVSTTTTQLRSDNGSTYVEVAGGGIVNVVAPTEVTINSPILNVTGVINIQNTGGSSSPCNINGNVIATGDVQAQSGGHKLSTHVHSGVQTGSGNSGGPVG